MTPVRIHGGWDGFFYFAIKGMLTVYGSSFALTAAHAEGNLCFCPLWDGIISGWDHVCWVGPGEQTKTCFVFPPVDVFRALLWGIFPEPSPSTI